MTGNGGAARGSGGSGQDRHLPEAATPPAGVVTTTAARTDVKAQPNHPGSLDSTSNGGYCAIVGVFEALRYPLFIAGPAVENCNCRGGFLANH
jgi:hypothetical protein